MDVGEKYISIKIVGHDWIKAFPNKNKEGNQPDYKGDGVGVWIQEKKQIKDIVLEKNDGNRS